MQIDQLRIQAQNIYSRTKGLSVPGDMVPAQRDLLLALGLRAEAMTKIAALVPPALGGQGQQASTKIAGDNEIFLASDVLFSQRVVPLIQQTLSAKGIKGLSTTSSRFLPNIGWLEPTTVLSRITGQATGATQNAVTPGNHGSALKGVSVGTNTLAPEPTLNHITGGGSPTFTVMVENSGEFNETNVKVDITVTAAGKQFNASHAINKTEPGKTVNVEIPMSGIPVGSGLEDPGEHRGRAGRERPRKQQEHLSGDLWPIGGRLPPPVRPSLARTAHRPRQRLTCGDDRLDHEHTGHHRDRRRRCGPPRAGGLRGARPVRSPRAPRAAAGAG